MKKAIITLAILTAAILSGCKSQTIAFTPTASDISWSAFCAARGYALDDKSATDEYLDTWCGSVEEEEALIAAGIDNY